MGAPALEIQFQSGIDDNWISGSQNEGLIRRRSIVVIHDRMITEGYPPDLETSQV